MTAGQPGARLQYADWLRFPNTYRAPTHEEWAASHDALRATVERLEAERQTFIDALWEYGHDVHGQHTGVQDGRCGLCSAYDSYVAAPSPAQPEGEK